MSAQRRITLDPTYERYPEFIAKARAALASPGISKEFTVFDDRGYDHPAILQALVDNEDGTTSILFTLIEDTRAN